MMRYTVPNYNDGDSVHEIIDAGLAQDAELHRFTNKAGEAYSAIYDDGFEVWSCERGNEEDMIRKWNSTR